ncbi:MAG: gamma carbonic anhydrase family protein [Planctomycetota bacterium]|nr:gamma carbonic anhydrase family protein [Planctomycetota bacterium]
MHSPFESSYRGPHSAWKAQSDAAPAPPEVPYPETYYDWGALHCRPLIAPSAWVAPGAVVLGRVELKAQCSIWYGCILRGDEEYIEVGEETNVQDGSILHVDQGFPCVLGKRVTLGHQAIVHGSTVGDGALIAIGATVLSRCVVGEGALIAAGALVLEGTQIPPHTLWAGVPAKQVKELEPRQRERLAHTYRHYVNNGQACLRRYGRAHIDALVQA